MSGNVYETINIRVRKSMEEIGDALDRLKVSWNGVVRQIDEKRDYEGLPQEYIYSTTTDKVAINFYGTQLLPMQFKKNWVVQVCIINLGTECNVYLTAVGSSSLHRFWSGKSQSIDLQYSIEKRNEIADTLHKLSW